MHNNDVSVEDRISILQQKIALWKNTHYSMSLDAQIATTLGDDQMLEQAKVNMKRALQAQDELEKILAEAEASGADTTPA